jgi:hypothetical protein
MQKDRIGLAFTVERGEAGRALRREDAEEYVMRELEKTGFSASGIRIEAFENQTGWLVFCTVERETETDVYIQFENKDDFLDAVRAHGSEGVKLNGWGSELYTVRVSGLRGRVAEYASLLGEFGFPFEAPPGYALHLEEQYGIL